MNLKANGIISSTSFVLGIVACLLVLSQFVVDLLTLPVVVATYPTQDEAGVACNSRQTLTFNRSMNPESFNSKTLILRDDHNQVIPENIAHDESKRNVVLSPSVPLHPGTAYRLSALGGKDGIKDNLGRTLAANLVWTFTTGVPAASSPTLGPGGPILLITSPENGFSQYYAEILRNEGFNEFAVVDVSHLEERTLQKYDVAVLGEVPLGERQVAALSRWVNAGGDLIAMRPDIRLAKAFGFEAASNSPTQADNQANNLLHDAYLAIQSNTSAGAGLVHEPIQFHGPATSYHVSKGAVLATLYNDAKTATPFPAISKIDFGRGSVILYSYDLARSVVYTRQGNPRWSGIERDSRSPIRSDDLFYGASPSDPQPDWVDPQKIAIPQADVQQRLFANIITLSEASKMPLPHFWYLPRGLKAVIVMTGDDHGGGGTVKRFKGFLAKSPKDCSVENWECVRATSNVFVGSIPSSQAASFAAQGFEIGLHVYTGCLDWPTRKVLQPDKTYTFEVDREAADALYRQQFAAFAAKYPGVPSPVSNRIDCVTWGDYDTQPQVELVHGIRFDTNYYFWPEKWVRNRPGVFTGSGMPMRFAKRDGSIIDVYQAATQMTDESAQQYPFTVETLLSNALGASEFYGVFTVNMHNDLPKSAGADAVISAALQRHVPVVTAAQMLKWLDGRNASSFQNLTWSKGQLSFNIDVGENASGIQALLPISTDAGNLASLSLDGVALEYQLRTIAGLKYAAFSGRPGKMQATYRQTGK